jgi:hypothetical protein
MEKIMERMLDKGDFVLVPYDDIYQGMQGILQHSGFLINLNKRRFYLGMVEEGTNEEGYVSVKMLCGRSRTEKYFDRKIRVPQGSCVLKAMPVPVSKEGDFVFVVPAYIPMRSRIEQSDLKEVIIGGRVFYMGTITNPGHIVEDLYSTVSFYTKGGVRPERDGTVGRVPPRGILTFILPDLYSTRVLE